MKQRRLLVFEDEFGMSSIYAAYMGYEYVPGEMIYDAGHEVILRAAQNPGCLKTRQGILKRLKADYALIIHDVDSVQHPELPMSPDEFKRHAVTADNVTFAPIVWCAETVALKLLDQDIDELTGNAKVVGNILADVSGIRQFKHTDVTLAGVDVKSAIDTYAAKESVNKKSLHAVFYDEPAYTKSEGIEFLSGLRPSSFVVNGYRFDRKKLLNLVPSSYHDNLTEFLSEYFDEYKQYGTPI